MGYLGYLREEMGKREICVKRWNWTGVPWVPGGAGLEIRICVKRWDSSGIPGVPGEGDER